MEYGSRIKAILTSTRDQGFKGGGGGSDTISSKRVDISDVQKHKHVNVVFVINEPHHENPIFAFAKRKTQISCVFATYITQSLYSLLPLNTRFQASSHLQWLYSPVCQTWSETSKNGFLMTWLILFFRLGVLDLVY